MPGFASRGIGLFVRLICLTVMCSAACAQTQLAEAGKPFPAGQVIDSVPCVADPTQDYALYLPSRYNPAKTWPIIYAFDPDAHGKVPVTLYKDTAEKYGYIVAASNNSRNFRSDAISKASEAVWEDTHTRLALDPRRIYMMGFSGGARVATALALRCENCAVAGVIAHGAGYPNSLPPSEKDHFAYFGFIGDRDFNWPELMELRRKKESWSAPFHLRVYAGDHQWAPPAMFEEAIEWLQLKAMQTGSVPPDAFFIDQLFARTQKEADDASQHKDTIAEFEAYRSLVSDFSGLKEVSQYQTNLRALQSSAELKQAIKKEQEAIGQQRAIVSGLSSKLSQAAAEPETQSALRNDIVDGMTALRNEADHARKEETRLVYLRAFNELWVQGIEAGQAELEVNKHLAKAEFYFQLMSSVTPDQPWPVLLLAETNALRGDKKRALKDLHEAVKRGLKHPESIDENANLQILRSEPEFQRIVAELKARHEPRPAQ